MGCLLKSFIVILVISIGVGYFIHTISQPPPIQQISLQYWGPGKEKPDDKRIKPFKISFPESDIKELKAKLASTKTLAPPLTDDFSYGFNTDYLKKFLDFWMTKYNWTEREAYLNQYPQFKTQIGGLDIHFIHVKPDAAKAKGKEVVPLLMAHGWPGSVREFYKIIPMLTTPRQDADFVFEVVAPSIPGYGFSQAASKTGLHIAHVGLIFNELMERLGFQKYFFQGGDWGAGIGQNLAVLLPDRVSGFHSNLCAFTTKKSMYYMLLFHLFPKLFIDEPHQELYEGQFSNLLLESGYYHLQATKPDTIGVGLGDSPAGLAAYILEKFSTWTNRDWRSLPDGGLENYDKVDLLDNVMIYYLTRTITSSMRLYKETIGSSAHSSLGLSRNKVRVPSACASFEHEVMYVPPAVIEEGFQDLVSLNFYPKGGHFAAFEQPNILSEDIWNFLKTLRKRKVNKKSQK